MIRRAVIDVDVSDEQGNIKMTFTLPNRRHLDFRFAAPIISHMFGGLDAAISSLLSHTVMLAQDEPHWQRATRANNRP